MPPGGRFRIIPDHREWSARLLAVLEMAHRTQAAQLETAAATLSPADRAALLASWHVFGDETGAQVANTKRAWETAVLKAHGQTPAWTKTTKRLTPASRAALVAIDLDFHDLRHEAGSRLLEAGWPLHHVQLMLGQANVSQTSTYLNATKGGLRDSMRRRDASRCHPVANDAHTAPPPVATTHQRHSVE